MAILDEPDFGDLMVTEMKKSNVSQPEDRHKARPPRDLPFLMDGDWFQVTNNDVRTWDFRWAKKHYILSPGEMMMVPFEALVSSLGDPRSMDNSLVKFSDGQGNRGIVMDRYTELARLFAMYAVENESMDELVQKAPKVTAKTLKGQTVRFPSQMPDMLPFPVMLIDDHAINTDTTKMIDAVAAENADLRDSIARLEERLDREISGREGIAEE